MDVITTSPRPPKPHQVSIILYIIPTMANAGQNALKQRRPRRHHCRLDGGEKNQKDRPQRVTSRYLLKHIAFGFK